MRLLFELSGEHKTLPRSEILACIEAEGYDHDVIEEDFRVLVLETDVGLQRLRERIALAHNVGEHLASGTASELEDSARALDVPSGTIAIRMKDHRPKPEREGNEKLLKRIGGILTQGRKVDLEAPENEIRVIRGNRYHMSLNKVVIDRSSFQQRKVDNRPFFSPISLHPKFARAMVNLSRAESGKSFLDPFCGTGGILIEAGMIGAKVIGGDIKGEMIEGCGESLLNYGIGSRLIRSDVGDIGEHVDKVHSIATDPPYGRSSTTMKEDPGSLYKRSFKALADILDEEGYLAIVLPKEEFAETGSQYLELTEVHKQRVHKSLDRYYCVFRNH